MGKAIVAGKETKLNKFLEGVLGLLSEMTLQQTPYDKRRGVVEVKEIGRRQEPRQSMSGAPLAGCREVVTVQGNARTISRFTQGTTPQGDVSEVHTHVGSYRWEISTEDWDRDS